MRQESMGRGGGVFGLVLGGFFVIGGVVILVTHSVILGLMSLFVGGVYVAITLAVTDWSRSD